MDSGRLRFITNNQQRIMADLYQANNDDNDVVILPPSHTGSHRYMEAAYHDSMAIVRHFGKPHLFITMTCNSKWPEITHALQRNETPSDRPGICTRVFNLSLKELIRAISVERIFGKISARIHTLEFQKRGLPHAHIVVFLEKDINVDEYDSIISAELPEKLLYPSLHEKVLQFMVHGPCTESSSCCENNTCKRGYP